MFRVVDGPRGCGGDLVRACNQKIPAIWLYLGEMRWDMDGPRFAPDPRGRVGGAAGAGRAGQLWTTWARGRGTDETEAGARWAGAAGWGTRR
jgi:hypothetical protein